MKLNYKSVCFFFAFNPNALFYIVVAQPTALSPIVDPPEQTVKEGNPSRINCHVPGHPSAILTWKKRDGALPDDAEQDDGVLTIERTDAQDAGLYICTARDPRGGPPADSRPARITVAPPSTALSPVVDPPEQTVKEGDPSRINCHVPGNPSAILTWKKRDGALPDDAEEDDGVLTIERTDARDAGLYICTARDPRGGPPADSQPARITVTKPLSPQVSPPEQTVDENSPSRIRCWVPGNPSAILKWEKRDGELPSNAQENRGDLIIPQTHRDDAGEYVCTARDPSGGEPVESSPAKINVRPRAPSKGPVINPPEQVVNEGEPTRFQCYVPGEQTSDLHFSHERADNPIPHGVREDRGMLIIDEAELGHAGDYICTYDSPDGPKHSEPASLVVNRKEKPVHGRPPSPVATPPEQTVQAGEPARFSCDANSDTPARIKWGYKTADGPLRGDVEQEEDDLVIHRADESNSGEYVCSARNEYGEGEADPVTLNVVSANEPPTVRVEPRTWNGQPGDRHQFTCTATGLPTPTLSWNGPRGSLPQDVNELEDGKILDFSDGRMELNGDYTCTASNPYGTASDFGSVNIAPRLDIVVTPPGPRIIVTAGEPVEIKCEAVVPSGDPEPVVEWLHDPGPERGDLPDGFVPVSLDEHYIRHPKIGLGNAGVYTCTGTSIHASAKKEIFIEVLEPSRVATVAILGGSKQWFEPHQTAELICVATGPSIVDRIQWVKTDGSLPIDVEDHNEPGALHFASFKASDSGEYECRGFRHEEVIASATVTVYATNAGPLEAARVEIDGPLVTAIQQGNSIVLNCRVHGRDSNDVTFKWDLLRKGSLIRHKSEDSTLKIERVDPLNDDGVYRCEVKDEKRELLGSAYSAVAIGHNSDSSADVQTFDEKVEAILKCPVFAVPGAEVIWEKMGNSLPEDSTSIRNKLVIPNFDDSKTGLYICKVRIDGSEVVGYVKAQIWIPNTIIQVLIEASEGNLAIGERAYFDCKVTGDPNAKITWTKDGEDELPDNAQVVGNRLLFTNLREDNTGGYKCSAKTSEGPLEARTVVNLSSPKRKRKHLSRTTRNQKIEEKNQKQIKKSRSKFSSWF